VGSYWIALLDDTSITGDAACNGGDTCFDHNDGYKRKDSCFHGTCNIENLPPEAIPCENNDVRFDGTKPSSLVYECPSSSQQCQYACMTGYHMSGNTCVDDKQTVKCTLSLA
jgi:hypothetical protein